MTTVEFHGTLTHEDSKRHIAHTFTMPPDATRLHITFEHTPERADGARYNNQVSLSLFDPNGSRGARHNNRDQTIRLSRSEASPGYFPGELPAGMWTVVVDTHRILPPDPLTYTISVTISQDPADAGEPLVYPPGTTAPRGPGWYRGDLHGHTLHSDGAWDVPDFFQYALDFGLDFVTLTDHNTVSGLAQLDSLRDDRVLTMGGVELTTYYGHALVLGTRQWQEWRRIDGLTMTDLARRAMDSGALFVIAHPLSPGDPACTGCRWEFDDMMPGIAPAVEVWNGIWREYNEQGLQLYYSWLNAGHRLVATTGTDIHGKPPPGVRGAAANVVYAEALSESAILAAVRQGHLYLSGGPRLELTGSADGVGAMMGDSLPTNPTHISAIWDGAEPSDRLRLIVDGAIADETAISADGEKTWTEFGVETRWLTVELRDSAGMMRALTNPIFIEPVAGRP